jgi:hypothetical protein
MRAIAVPACAFVAAACSSTTFAEPRILVSPYLALYRLRGDVAVQSQPVPAGPLQDNPAQDLRTFGQTHYREDIGVRADIGDGFGGLRIDYYRLDMGTSRFGTLGGDWGALQAGDSAQIRAEMDELRLSLVEPIAVIRSTWRDRPLVLRFGLGGTVAHRDLVLRGKTEDGARTQRITAEGDVLYANARFRASWRDFAVDLDYAASPGVALRGDFEDFQQDVELRASWTMPLHDVTFFAGWRWSELVADGDASGLGYDAKLWIDGFQFGVSVTF